MLHLSCHMNWPVGLPLTASWTLGSFVTNLVLQKIVVMRAAFLDKSKLPKVLMHLFRVEVAIAIVAGCLMVVSVGAGVVVEASAARSAVLICFGGLTCGFICCDLAFSVVCCIVMRRVVSQ